MSATTDPLSRRERQILDILYAKGAATAAEVREALPDPPSYSAVRALLRILEEKGHAKHETQGTRYVYLPSVSRERARNSALTRIVTTFFDGSAAQATRHLIWHFAIVIVLLSPLLGRVAPELAILPAGPELRTVAVEDVSPV